jgi:hypothetical protein
LPYAVEAPFDSYHRRHEPTCLDDTRVDLLREIYNWADEQDERYIFWLSGLAGTGKSTIARTVAREYSERKRLGASFFFSRGSGDVGHAGKFVTTIARQLATRSSSLRGYISEAVSGCNQIASQGLREQWNQLISRPLSQSLTQLSTSSIQSSFIIVIDALDECEGDDDIRLILQLLSEANSSVTTRPRIFITSRPETPVRNSFRKMQGIIHRDLVLHNVSEASVNHDITVFFNEKFKEMRDEFEDLPAGWPGDDKIQYLVQRADGLFIYAATVCRFIKGDEQWLPQDLLDLLIPGDDSSQSPNLDQDVPSKPPTWELDIMYTRILERSINRAQDGPDKSRLLQAFKQVVGSIAILIEPLSAVALAKLLNVRTEAVNLRVRNLHSVLNVPRSEKNPIRLLHPSFRDFLLDKDRGVDSNIWVDGTQAHRTLADSCIQLMSISLRQDICGMDAPGVLIASVESSRVEQCLPPEVQYACLYWVQHLEKCGGQIYDNDNVHHFLQTHLLHWLEALSWMRKISEGILAIISLGSIASVSLL